MPKALYFANTDWYLWNFRLPLIRSVRDRGWDVVLVAPPGPWLERLAADGFRCVPYPFERHGLNPFTELGVLVRLMRLYRGERPDLTHHFTVKCVLYGSIAARMAGKAAVVNAMTGLGTLFTSPSLAARMLRRPLRVLYRLALRGNEVIFQNPDDRAELEAQGLLEGAHVSVIKGSGIDTRLFTPSVATAPRPVTVILVGRLIAEKGIEEFVEAATRLRDSGVNARFLAVGGPDPAQPSAIDPSRLDQWKAASVVEFLGHRDDVRALLQGADIVCLPSWREGTPRSVLEAMACGLPAVVTDVPGCREVVRNGDNGLVVPPRDPVALASALRQLIEDPQMRARMGQRSRQRTLEEFSLEHVVEQTHAAYRAALARAGGPTL